MSVTLPQNIYLNTSSRELSNAIFHTSLEMSIMNTVALLWKGFSDCVPDTSGTSCDNYHIIVKSNITSILLKSITHLMNFLQSCQLPELLSEQQDRDGNNWIYTNILSISYHSAQTFWSELYKSGDSTSIIKRMLSTHPTGETNVCKVYPRQHPICCWAYIEIELSNDPVWNSYISISSFSKSLLWNQRVKRTTTQQMVILLLLLLFWQGLRLEQLHFQCQIWLFELVC